MGSTIQRDAEHRAARAQSIKLPSAVAVAADPPVAASPLVEPPPPAAHPLAAKPPAASVATKPAMKKAPAAKSAGTESRIQRGAERRAAAKAARLEAAKPAVEKTPPPVRPKAPKVEDRLVMTKAKMRETVAEILVMNRRAGVPDAGIAEILTQWLIAHVTRGTKIVV